MRYDIFKVIKEELVHEYLPTEDDFIYFLIHLQISWDMVDLINVVDAFENNEKPRNTHFLKKDKETIKSQLLDEFQFIAYDLELGLYKK